jgi:hypothetical protein
MKQLALLSVALTLLGCAIHQRVDPVPRLESQEICIINNPAVREGFLLAYQRALTAKGFQTKILDKSAAPNDCPLTSTYTANWRWDLALYMAFADITVYANGKKVGQAVYDSLGGSGNLGKFINAEDKVNELVDQLFPNPASAG